MKNQQVSIFFTFLIILILPHTTQQELGKLVMVQELFRHGARYPGQVLGIGDEYAGQQQSLGELTSQGKTMHYLLGKKLYEVYWNKLFEGTPFQYRYNQSKFLVKSTNYNRTIESAQSHLAGILGNLPPLNISTEDLPYSIPPYPGVQRKAGYVYGQFGKYIHPIAIHTTDQVMTPFQDGDFLERWSARNCPNQNQWRVKNFKNPKLTKLLNNQRYKKALQEFSEYYGRNITLNNFTYYYDNLKCMYYQGKQVPEIFKGPSQTSQALKQLFTITMYIIFYGNQMQVRAQASEFIQATINNMKSVQTNKYSSPQWIIYSAHDLTVAAILAITNLWNFECFQNNISNKTSDCIITYPNFASDLIFELYQYGESYRFKINYEGIHRRIPFCNFELECPVETLYQAFQKWKVNDIRGACGVPYYYTREAAYILLGIAIVLIIWIISMKMINSKVKKD